MKKPAMGKRYHIKQYDKSDFPGDEININD
jgi:hypothetical protein